MTNLSMKKKMKKEIKHVKNIAVTKNNDLTRFLNISRKKAWKL